MLGCNDGSYWGLFDVVRSIEQVKCDRLATVSVVRIIFPVLRKKDGAVVGKYDGSSFHPRMCGTKGGFIHSVVQVKREEGVFPHIVQQVMFMFGVPSVCIFVVRFSDWYFQMCWDADGHCQWEPGSIIFGQVGGGEM